LPIEIEPAPIVPEEILPEQPTSQSLAVQYSDTVPFFDDLGRFDPNTIDSVTTV
jgi:hypothetical protein